MNEDKSLGSAVIIAFIVIIIGIQKNAAFLKALFIEIFTTLFYLALACAGLYILFLIICYFVKLIQQKYRAALAWVHKTEDDLAKTTEEAKSAIRWCISNDRSIRMHGIDIEALQKVVEELKAKVNPSDSTAAAAEKIVDAEL